MNIRQLAHYLDLSITTVSRALGGYDDVSEATRQRVTAAAQKHGYQPNRAAQGLRSGKAGAVGFVLPMPPQQFASPLFAEIIAGLGEVLADAGLDLMVTACSPGPHETEYYRKLAQGKRVDAVILTRARVHDERVALLQERGVPFVMHGRTEAEQPYAFLDIDSEEGFYQAARCLLTLGHRRFALINAPDELNSSVVRRAGVVRALSEAGLSLDAAHSLSSDLTEDGGQRAADRLLNLHEPPSAILCVNDQTAFGVIHAARQRGLKVGHDLSVIGYDDVPFARYSDPPLTTLGTSSREAGRELARLQLRLLAGAAPETLQRLWTPELKLRSTHGPPPP